MASTRLTRSIKDILEKELLMHRFSGELGELMKDRAELAEYVYNDAYCNADQAIMSTLEPGWLPESEAIGLAVGEHGSPEIHKLAFNGQLTRYNHGLFAYCPKRPVIKRRLKYRNFSGDVALIVAKDHELAIRAERLEQRQQQIGDQLAATRTGVKRALESVTTVGKLISEWPEIEPFAKRFLGQPPPQLPAVSSARLNEMLDLPVEEAA